MAALAAAVNIPVAWREALLRPLRRLARVLRQAARPLRATSRSRERMATVITGSGQAVASQLMAELGRGVTAIKGAGVYTGEARDVLLCATTDIQGPRLREIVQQADPRAFVVVSRAEDVRGWKVLGMRRRALRAAELEQFLLEAGSVSIDLLPKSGEWDPHEVVAVKPSA